MPSERTINPAQAHRKAEKAKALKKSKAQLATQRAEKLARRNPARLERQIEALADEERSAGSLRPKDKQTLEQLRKDVQAIRKARERLGVSKGDYDNDREGGKGGYAAGRKRKWDENGTGNGDRHDGDFDRARRRREGRSKFGGREHDDGDDDDASDSGFSTDESVRRIPMPRDTPPPIPAKSRRRRSYVNQWNNGVEGEENGVKEEEATYHRQRSTRADGKEETLAQAKAVYEAAPAVRDLRREATTKFIPSVVKGKLDLAQGKGRLLEENEVVSLSRSGYIKSAGENFSTSEKIESSTNLEHEEKRFEAELDNIVDSQQASRTATVEGAEGGQ